MSSSFIGLLGSKESGKTSLAEMFGKKGISSDMTLYTQSKGAFTNIIDPIKYPSPEHKANFNLSFQVF